MDAYSIIQPIKISGLSVWTCLCWQKIKQMFTLSVEYGWFVLVLPMCVSVFYNMVICGMKTATAKNWSFNCFYFLSYILCH